MTRIFAYCRVSTTDQTTDNQVQEIEAAGFSVAKQRVITETVSGSVPAFDRKGFAKLVDRLEDSDVLIVTKLDRLGRNAIDVRSTVERLASIGVRVHCLALGGVDLTSAAGKMTMGVISAVAEFERDLLIERTQAGLRRAKAEGKTFGRPSALSEAQRSTVIDQLNAGLSVAQIAREMKTSRQTIMRVRAGMAVENESVEQGQLGPDGVPCALVDWPDRRKSRGA
ncbi:recombinase family protein [Paraburkholderia silviterrae]|uniref:Recombinase family protein n=1 Tax=Paraburkholderia silviterrae TaxID=2528715 RepID=A0A4R5MCB9_9BURK|nr:recombinase family protein [Paraburkholderia silviterrae]TDG24499.1 recombinase family protein [Paraburkholderia silviterrae]